MDVDLELEPALDTPAIPPPAPTGMAAVLSQSRASRGGTQGMSFPGMELTDQADTRFPGVGRRLGGP